MRNKVFIHLKGKRQLDSREKRRKKDKACLHHRDQRLLRVCQLRFSTSTQRLLVIDHPVKWLKTKMVWDLGKELIQRSND